MAAVGVAAAVVEDGSSGETTGVARSDVEGVRECEAEGLVALGGSTTTTVPSLPQYETIEAAFGALDLPPPPTVPALSYALAVESGPGAARVRLTAIVDRPFDELVDGRDAAIDASPWLLGAGFVRSGDAESDTRADAVDFALPDDSASGQFSVVSCAGEPNHVHVAVHVGSDRLPPCTDSRARRAACDAILGPGYTVRDHAFGQSSGVDYVRALPDGRLEGVQEDLLLAPRPSNEVGDVVRGLVEAGWTLTGPAPASDQLSGALVQEPPFATTFERSVDGIVVLASLDITVAETNEAGIPRLRSRLVQTTATPI